MTGIEVLYKVSGLLVFMFIASSIVCFFTEEYMTRKRIHEPDLKVDMKGQDI